MRNLLYVRAGVESLPPELTAVADQLTVILPWGSLLAAIARPSVPILRSIRALCVPDARLTVVFGIDPVRDHAEGERLGLPLLDAVHLKGPLVAGYAAAGFAVTTTRALSLEALADWPSTWARRLAHGQPRSVFRVDARAAEPVPLEGPFASMPP
jgi:16S rRNA (adenine(1408)-N(1))-methyltransferase